MHSQQLQILDKYHPYVTEVKSEFVSSGDLDVHWVLYTYYSDIPESCVSRLQLRTLCNVSATSLYYRYLDRPREPTAFGPLNNYYHLLFCRKLHLVKKLKRNYKKRKLKLLSKKITKDLALLIFKYF